MFWWDVVEQLAPCGASVMDEGRLVLHELGQRVTIERGVAFEDEEWLIAFAVIAPEDETHQLDALRFNDRFAIGALAIVEGQFGLRWASPLAPLDAEALDRYLAFVVREARRIRGVHGRLTAAELALREFTS